MKLLPSLTSSFSCPSSYEWALDQPSLPLLHTYPPDSSSLISALLLELLVKSKDLIGIWILSISISFPLGPFDTVTTSSLKLYHLSPWSPTTFLVFHLSFWVLLYDSFADRFSLQPHSLNADILKKSALISLSRDPHGFPQLEHQQILMASRPIPRWSFLPLLTLPYLKIPSCYLQNTHCVHPLFITHQCGPDLDLHCLTRTF